MTIEQHQRWAKEWARRARVANDEHNRAKHWRLEARAFARLQKALAKEGFHLAAIREKYVAARAKETP